MILKLKAWKKKLSLAAGFDKNEGFRLVSNMLEEMAVYLQHIPELDAKGVGELRLVADEITTNAIRHSPEGKDVTVRLSAEFCGDGVISLRIADDGAAFNPLAQGLPYVGADLDKRNVGGLGLYFIRQLFPLAKYQRLRGCNVTEVKYHPGEAGKKEMCRHITSKINDAT